MIKDYAADNAELLERAAAGDEDARNELVVTNMGLVHSIVRRFAGRGHETEDLFQIGCVGLIRAAERFDPRYGVMFSTYAVPVIMGEIKRFIRDDGIIKVSRSLKETAAKAAQIEKKLADVSGTEPTLAEIANELGVESSYLATAIDAQARPQSLYMTTDDGTGEGRPLIDKIENEEDPIDRMLSRVVIGQTLHGLEEREKIIVYCRYYCGLTQMQVAKRLGISQVQVSRLEKKILHKMRKEMEA